MELLKTVPAAGCRELLEEFYASDRLVKNARILKFGGVGGADVYNASVPFEIDGRTVIAGRVEMRDTEHSRTVFFEEAGGVWMPVEGAPVLDLQDPFVTKLGDEIVVGGVWVEWDEDRLVTYRTDFYRGRSLSGLRLFLSGPPLMKDVRIAELPGGRIAVFSRPQGQPMLERFGCVAKIGFAVCDSIEKVTARAIADAPLLEGHFLPDEWGGCNQLHILKNGLIGAIGHKSYMDGEPGAQKIHYHGIAFVLDPATRRMTQNWIISTRKCFPAGPQKNFRSADVTFTAGILRNGDGTAELYTGLSDCQVGAGTIPDPFGAFE